MLITENFVFLHVPKTAGTFIQSVIRDHVPVADHRLGTHAPHHRLPQRAQRLPGLYVVRNPWDWYVSWFFWTTERGRARDARGKGVNPGTDKQAVWENVLRSGRADFREAVERACSGDFEHPLAPLMRSEGLDLYSAYVRSIVGDALERPDYTALKVERLRRPLVQFLEVHADVSPALARAIRREPRQRVSIHRDYREYYDDELRELVGEKTRWLQERFGYKFRAVRTASAPGSAPSARGSRSGRRSSARARASS